MSTTVFDVMPDPDLAGEAVYTRRTASGEVYGVVRLDDASQLYGVLRGFRLVPPAWGEGDQYDFDGEVVATYATLGAALAAAGSAA